MRFPALRRLIAVAFLSLLFQVSQSQPTGSTDDSPLKKAAKPYKVLTAGKDITIKSTKDIQHIMLWTAGGNRVLEQKEINASSYTFTIPVNDKAFFLMIGLTNGKIYTEKIGVR